MSILVIGWLLFYDISTLVGYLIPNPVLYIHPTSPLDQDVTYSQFLSKI